MAQDIDEKELYTYLNKNVIAKGKFYGIPKRNIYEAIFFTFSVWLIILSINFTDIVTRSSIIVLCPIIFLICIRGIKNRSVIQLIWNEIKFKRNRKLLHLRSPEYVRKENIYARDENSGESILEAIERIATEKIRDFIEKNSSH